MNCTYRYRAVVWLKPRGSAGPSPGERLPLTEVSFRRQFLVPTHTESEAARARGGDTTASRLVGGCGLHRHPSASSPLSHLYVLPSGCRRHNWGGFMTSIDSPRQGVPHHLHHSHPQWLRYLAAEPGAWWEVCFPVVLNVFACPQHQVGRIYVYMYIFLVCIKNRWSMPTQPPIRHEGR